MTLAKHLNKKVLIADDFPNMRADLQKILKSLGFTNVKEVQDGKEAWETLRLEAQYGEPFEIIFSDINMPFISGLALLKTLRSTDSYKKIPIFIVSTENEKETILKAIIDGATDYIIKPYEEEVVKAKIISRLK